MPLWPLDLPQAPLRDGWSDTAPDNLLRSDMESGPAKVRRRGSAKPRVAACTYVMNAEEAALFEDFALGTLAGGALAFDWWHPVLGRYVRARLVPSGDGLYSRSYWGGTYVWQYSLTIEYWPDVPVDANTPPEPELPEEEV